MNYTALGHRIRELRKKHKLTQSQLSGKVGVSVSFFGHIERGSRKASIETLLSIADALGVTPNDLLMDSISQRKLNYCCIHEFVENMRALLIDMEKIITDETGDMVDGGYGIS